MNLLRRLWRLEGTVDRKTYLLGGAIGFAVKFAIDWTVATQLFGLRWTPLSYWKLLDVDGPRLISPASFAVMLAVSLPFLWFGMAMTLLRLRDAGRTAGWAALFFVPVVNALLFAVLSLVPPRTAARRDLSAAMESALFAAIGGVALGAVTLAISTQFLELYGFGLFVAVPFCVGYLGGFLYTRRHPESRAGAFAVTCFSLVLLGGLLLSIAWEGVICLLMAMPIALVVALFGAWCGQVSARRTATLRPAYMTVALLPLILMAEAAVNPAPPRHRVESSIVIDAPPDRVWQNVVTFSEITEVPEWFFRAGLAYPLRARIDGRGPGAIRYCEFTTGAFVEPIEVWDEPRLLQFSVAQNPPPMRELSPYGAIDAKHLHGYLRSERGQFLLEPLPNGRTRLTGTTWYRHRLWPSAYWRLWSDAIIHRIHMRVLRHIDRETTS